MQAVDNRQRRLIGFTFFRLEDISLPNEERD